MRRHHVWVTESQELLVGQVTTSSKSSLTLSHSLLSHKHTASSLHLLARLSLVSQAPQPIQLETSRLACPVCRPVIGQLLRNWASVPSSGLPASHPGERDPKTIWHSCCHLIIDELAGLLHNLRFFVDSILLHSIKTIDSHIQFNSEPVQ